MLRASIGLSLALLVGCEGVDTRTFVITTYTPADPSCAELPRGAQLELRAVGDHAVPNGSFVVPGQALAVPEGTRGFEARTDRGEPPFAGFAPRSTAEEQAILLWPLGRDCRLDEGARYPALGGAQGLGYSPESRTVLLAGGEDPDERPSTSLGGLTFDAGTGRAGYTTLPDRGGPRAFASVTALGDHLLVAGGEDPLNSENDVVTPSRSAELYEVSRGDFASNAVELRVPRTRHSAIALPSGEALLVGGRGPFGDALNVLEVVSPATLQSSLSGLVALQVPRLFPSVLKLEDGRLLIAGGAAADESPLSAMEWLSADARRAVGLAVFDELPARFDRAFAALPGGSVLVVGGCAPRPPEPSEDCSACRRGCPPRGTDGTTVYDAWWISPDNELTALEFPIAAPRPVLLGGADGQPLLVPGEGDVAYRFEPWSARFRTHSELGAALPELRCPPRAGLPSVALDDQTHVWVGECGGVAELRGARLGARSPFGDDVVLAPDRALSEPPAVRWLGERAFSLDASAAARVHLAGLKFGDFELELGYERAPPLLVVTAEARVGALLVDLAPASAPGRRVRVRRAGTNLYVGEGAHELPDGPVRIGFAAPRSGSTVTDFDVKRLP